MTREKLFAAAVVISAGLVATGGAIAIAQATKESNSAAKPEQTLPPGWTEDDFKAMMAAGTPGKMHERLARDIGVWRGKTTMWMTPDAEPMKSECTSTVKAMMGGRFTSCEIEGEMPGMGPFHAFGIYGFDNVSKKFVSTFLDNHSTGIMKGEGQLSEDGRTLSWKYTFNCPIVKKPVVLREVETITGPKTKTLEMFGPEPKSGKEFKMMSIALTKK